jgi:hypothetical protein
MSSSVVSSYEIQIPTATIIKNIFLPEFPDINFKNKTLTFIKSTDGSYIFKLDQTYNHKIIILKQDSFIWNRYP